jgi:multidrug efflux pump subunit AcrB
MISRFFIDRPIFAMVISIVITLAGAVALFTLPIAQYPEIAPPTVSVSCMYSGANAEVVSDTVAAPIEQQVNGVEGMLYMSSQCTNDGSYTLTITFALGADLNMAQVLVQNRVSLALPQLPPEVQVTGVTVKKKSPSILLCINLISPEGKYDDLYLSNYATIQIKDELLRLDGVGDLTYLGQRDYSMRVWLDADAMAARELSASDIINAVKNQNMQVVAGQIGQPPVPAGQQFQLTMSTLGRLVGESEFGNIIVKTGQGSPTQGDTSAAVVRLRDVARVELGAQQYNQVCKLDGESSVALAIFLLPGSNAIATAQSVKAKMEELKQRFPAGLDYKIVYDTTPFVMQSIAEVEHALIDAVILVGLVVMIFLQNWRVVLIPLIAVPVAIVGTFAVMAAIGFSLNNISLLGLVLAIGIVVDDAIVVVENVERWMDQGMSPKEAARKAMDEVTAPIIAVALVLTAVFVPAAFMTGITGQFFKQFAITIAVSTVFSTINSLTLSPAMAGILLKPRAAGEGAHHGEALPRLGIIIAFALLAAFFALPWIEPYLPPSIKDSENWLVQSLPRLALGLAGAILGFALAWVINRALRAFFTVFNRIFDLATRGYTAAIGLLLTTNLIVLAAYGALLFATYWFMTHTPVGFIPDQDQGYLLVNVQLPDSASLERTVKVMDRVDTIAREIPGVGHTLAISGQSFLLSANSSNFGSTFVILKPFDQRESHEEYDAVIAQKLRARYNAEIPDAVVSVFRAPPVQGLGNAGGFQLQVEQRGFVDVQALEKQTSEFIAASRKDPLIGGMFTLFRADTPQYYLDIDRTKCESLMVDVKDVFTALQTFMGGYYVNLFNEFGRTWQVNILAEDRFRTDVDKLKLLKVRNRLGEMVPLATLVDPQDIGGPVLTMRYNMYSSSAVNGNPAPGVSSGEVIRAVGELAAQTNTTFEWTQITYMQILAGNVALLVFALGSVLVFLVLAAQYESWKLPLAVILVVPMCLLCSVIGVALVKNPVDIFVQVGFLVLVGLAAKNAILIVEFAREQHAAGKDARVSALEACRLRLRPILMTSFAFIGGVVPLILASGAGAEMRRNLGIAVFSGMLGVTIFGIFLTPVFYYVVMWFQRKQAGKPEHPSGGGGSGPGTPDGAASITVVAEHKPGKAGKEPVTITIPR